MRFNQRPSDRLRRILAASLLAAVAACAVTDDDADGAEGNLTDGPTKKATLDVVDEDGLYHWSEGSEFLPYFAVRALKVLERNPDGTFTGHETDDFILSEKNLAKYGFIPDQRPAARRVAEIASDSMPDGAASLPIGMTLARAPDTGFVSVGVNCASCHVGQLKIDGKVQIINGVPNMFEVGRFFGEVIQTLDFIAKTA